MICLKVNVTAAGYYTEGTEVGTVWVASKYGG